MGEIRRDWEENTLDLSQEVLNILAQIAKVSEEEIRNFTEQIPSQRGKNVYAMLAEGIRKLFVVLHKMGEDYVWRLYETERKNPQYRPGLHDLTADMHVYFSLLDSTEESY